MSSVETPHKIVLKSADPATAKLSVHLANALLQPLLCHYLRHINRSCPCSFFLSVDWPRLENRFTFFHFISQRKLDPFTA